MTDALRSRLVSLLIPGLQNVFWIALFIAVVSKGPAMMNIDGDLGRHITIGNYIIDTRSIPTADVFSHTMAGQPLTPHEWLAQVLFALADRLMGLDGVVLLTALVIAAAFGLTLTLAVKRSGSLLVGLGITLLAAGAASLHWLTRPHIFTFLLLVLWLRVLISIQEGKTWRWIWMPVIMFLWVNLHGAFIAGFVVWLLVLAGLSWERWVEGLTASQNKAVLKDFLIGGAASLLVSFINPSGIHLWETSLGYLRNEYLVGHTAEYLSPDFHRSSTWLFLLLIVLLIGLFGLVGKRRKAEDLFFSVAWMGMSFVSARNIPLFAIVTAPILAASTTELTDAYKDRFSWLKKVSNLDQRLMQTERMLRGWVWPAAAFLVVVLLLSNGARLDPFRVGNRFDPENFPVQAVDWLKSNPQTGNVFNYFPWGGYLLYRDWPETQVFIDGQTDFYGEELTRKYESVLTLDDGWENILAEYSVKWVIFPVDEKLVKALANSEKWVLIYQDDTAAILQRK